MRRRLITMMCLGLAVTLSGCGEPTSKETGKPGASSLTAPTSTTLAAKTADPPTVFDKAAAVALPATAAQGNLAGNVVARYSTLHQRTAYIVAPDGLSAVDVLTGEQRWTIKIDGVPADPQFRSGPFVTNAGPRPPVVNSQGGLVVAAVPTSEPGKGTTPGYQALTVFAVGAHSGTKNWETKIRIPDSISGGKSRGATTKVAAITESAIVAGYRNEEAMTVVLDPATGNPLWERPEYEAGSVHGDVLVGMDAKVAENSSMSQATALTLTTGQHRWVGAARSSSLTVVPADPALVVVDATDYGTGDPALLFLDPGTGAERGKLTRDNGFGSSAYGECEYDKQSVLVCLASGRLAGYDAKSGKQLWTLPDPAANRIAPKMTAVWHGALYGTTPNGPVVLDAKTGKDLSTEPGATPYWVSEYAGIGVDAQGVPQAYPIKR